jgi:hypothetical protein
VERTECPPADSNDVSLCRQNRGECASSPAPRALDPSGGPRAGPAAQLLPDEETGPGEPRGVEQPLSSPASAGRVGSVGGQRRGIRFEAGSNPCPEALSSNDPENLAESLTSVNNSHPEPSGEERPGMSTSLSYSDSHTRPRVGSARTQA